MKYQSICFVVFHICSVRILVNSLKSIWVWNIQQNYNLRLNQFLKCHHYASMIQSLCLESYSVDHTCRTQWWVTKKKKSKIQNKEFKPLTNRCTILLLVRKEVKLWRGMNATKWPKNCKTKLAIHLPKYAQSCYTLTLPKCSDGKQLMWVPFSLFDFCCFFYN